MPWWGWIASWFGLSFLLGPVIGSMLKRSREALEAVTYETPEEWLEAQKEAARERSRQRAVWN